MAVGPYLSELEKGDFATKGSHNGIKTEKTK